MELTWEAWDWIKPQLCHSQLCDFGQDTHALWASRFLYVPEGLLQRCFKLLLPQELS